MKKINWTNNTDVRLGFEVECVIGGEYYRKFAKTIRSNKHHISIGSDGSIETVQYGPFVRAIELRTPPLPPKDAMELLKEIFNLVNEYGLTNASCGLHVNISSSRRAKMRNFNPIPFLSSTLWDEILRKFSRRNNGYCRAVLTPQRRKNKFLALRALNDACVNKYKCVTLCNFGAGLNKSSRVEVRGFGNKDYTQKYPLIEKFVKRIEKLFRLSCADAPLTRTFAV